MGENWLRKLFGHKAESSVETKPDKGQCSNPLNNADTKPPHLSLLQILGLSPQPDPDDDRYDIERVDVNTQELNRLSTQLEAEATAREAQTKTPKK